MFTSVNFLKEGMKEFNYLCIGNAHCPPSWYSKFLHFRWLQFASLYAWSSIIQINDLGTFLATAAKKAIERDLHLNFNLASKMAAKLSFQSNIK